MRNPPKTLYAHCQFCGKPVQADIREGGQEGAKTALKLKLELHVSQCDDNPNKKKTELDEFLDGLKETSD